MKKENVYQPKVIEKLNNMFPGCIIQKEDSEYIQGIPDLLILYKDKWATLECKKSKDEPHQPNQDYYVDVMDGMSFSRFIFPENETEVLNDLSLFFNGGNNNEV
jgi:hypothetical protein